MLKCFSRICRESYWNQTTFTTLSMGHKAVKVLGLSPSDEPEIKLVKKYLSSIL